MKIKSIRLTSEREDISTSGLLNPIATLSNIPIIKVDYEETTLTGLVAKGTRVLTGELSEIALEFFKELENDILIEIEKETL